MSTSTDEKVPWQELISDEQLARLRATFRDRPDDARAWVQHWWQSSSGLKQLTEKVKATADDQIEGILSMAEDVLEAALEELVSEYPDAELPTDAQLAQLLLSFLEEHGYVELVG